MKYKIFKDEENYLTGFEHTNTEQDIFELNPQAMNLDYINCYYLVEDEVVFDEEKYKTLISMDNLKKEVEYLKHQLSDTDYKIIKCSEYQLAGLEIPYDVAKLHKDRQELRDKINALEN